MHGKGTFRLGVERMAEAARLVCAEAGWDLEDVDLLVPHQANLRIIEAVAKRLDMPLDRVVVNIDRYGNTSGASIPIALAEAVESGRVRQGDRMVFIAFGSGRRVGRDRSAMDRADALTSRRQAPRRRLQAPGPELRPTAPTAGTVACPHCQRRFVADRYAADLNVCSGCGHHGVVGATQRIEQLADAGTAELLAIDAGDRDPLGFDDGVPYPQRVARARERTGLHEAFQIARASIERQPRRPRVHGLRLPRRVARQRRGRDLRPGLRRSRSPRGARSWRCAPRAVRACRRASHRSRRWRDARRPSPIS